MQNIDIFSLVLGVLASSMMIYLLIGLFPGAEQRQQAFERRLKPGGGTIIPMSRLRRAVGTLMIGMFAVQLLAGAFHTDLSKLTGVSSRTIFYLTLLLPALFFVIGVIEYFLNKRNKTNK